MSDLTRKLLNAASATQNRDFFQREAMAELNKAVKAQSIPFGAAPAQRIGRMARRPRSNRRNQ